MIQTRICSYYEHNCTHVRATPITFLSLPEEVRDRIYGYANEAMSGASIRIYGRQWPRCLRETDTPFALASFCMRRRHENPVYCINFEKFLAHAASDLISNLNASNSAISADVARFLCSHNEILVCCEHPTDLSVLLEFPLELLKSCRRMNIHINPASCHTVRGLWQHNCCHRDTFDNHKAYSLKSTSNSFHALISIWRKVVRRLGSPADISRLRLNILCDLGDVTTAQLIVEPLERTGLAISTLRLGSSHGLGLLDVACRTVLSKTPCQMKAKSFRFLDLPSELRLHILSFTDVVTPHCEVEYKTSGNYICTARQEDRTCISREFCAYGHVVYPHCGCWTPPTAIFLVCKGMLRDARAIFFASNSFTVALDSRIFYRSVIGRPFEASVFLRKVVPRENLSNLRSLELLFPPVFYDFAGGHEDTLRHWVDTIDFVAPRLKKLKLRLIMGKRRSPLLVAPRQDDECPEYTRGRLEETFQIHEQIVRPLQKLKSLDSLLVSVYTPFLHEDWEFETTVRPQLQACERRLETLVMGSVHESVKRERLDQ